MQKAGQSITDRFDGKTIGIWGNMRRFTDPLVCRAWRDDNDQLEIAQQQTEIFT